MTTTSKTRGVGSFQCDTELDVILDSGEIERCVIKAGTAATYTVFIKDDSIYTKINFADGVIGRSIIHGTLQSAEIDLK